MIPLSLPLKLCFAAVVWPLPLSFRGHFKPFPFDFFTMHGEPCKGICQNFCQLFSQMYLPPPVQALVTFIGGSILSHSLSVRRFRYTQESHQPKTWLCGILWENTATAERLRGRFWVVLSWNISSGHYWIAVQWCCSSLCGRELPSVDTSHVLEPRSWAIKPNCKWRASSFRRRNLSSKLWNSPK